MISEKFMWGAAMAANQCEGAYLEEGKGLSIVDLLPDAAHGRWDMLYHPEKYLDRELSYYPSHEAIDFYHRYFNQKLSKNFQNPYTFLMFKEIILILLHLMLQILRIKQ